MLRPYTLTLFFSCVSLYYSIANAATFPPLIDTRVQPATPIQTGQPEIIVPDDAYLELITIDDIDNDGLRDFQFQIFTPEDFDALAGFDSEEPVECPSVYIALSGMAGDTLDPADAVEIRGFEAILGPALRDYGCFFYYGVEFQVVPDINGDGINELFFYGDNGFDPYSDNPSQNIVAYGRTEKGAVIDIADAVDGQGGFLLSNNLYLQNTIGDINGDAIADPLIHVYPEDYNYSGSSYRAYIVDGQSFDSIGSLSTDTLNNTNILHSFEAIAGLQVIGSADFNNDQLRDIVITEHENDGGIYTYVLYGSTELPNNARLSEFDACRNQPCSIKLAGDFNGDGFDDVLLANIPDTENQVEKHLIVYSEAAGLPSVVEPENSTNITFSDYPDGYFNFSGSVGDINGDGASDLYFQNYNAFDIVLLGQKQQKPEDIDTGKLNGETGFIIVPESEYHYSLTQIKDTNNDGLDDIVSEDGQAVMLYGKPVMNLPQGVQGLSVATGQTMTFLNWLPPDASQNIDRLEIFVDNSLVDTIDANKASYRFSLPAPNSQSVLKLQYVNNESAVSPAVEVPLSNEFQALKQLRANIISHNSVELVWDNEPNDYIVWRNGSLLAQVNGNSYIDSGLQAGVEYRYHITQGPDAFGLNLGRSTTLPAYTNPFDYGCIDYCGDGATYDYYDPYDYDPYFYDDCDYYQSYDYRISAYRQIFPASTDELILVTDNTGVEFSTPRFEIVNTCAELAEFRVLSNGYQVYSQTALEIFWERATHPSGIASYEVTLFDQIIANRDATSLFVDNVGDDSLYEYKVTAIAVDGSRSIPAVYSVYIAENDQNYLDYEQDPPGGVSLRAEVYSSTAAELFWETIYDNSGTPVNYEIYRNGEYLLTSDARSYFDDTLAANSTYSYEVITISVVGILGSSSSIQFSTPSGSGAGNADPDNIPDNPVPDNHGENVLPTGLRGQVYSNSALELFWHRPEGPGIKAYEIQRNDEVIANTDGITFFDSGLDAETQYRYAIRALDSDGIYIGEPAYIELTTTR